MRRTGFAALVLMAAMLGPIAPAQAELVARTDSGFVVHQVVETTASPAAAWKMLLQPEEWWNSQHTWSGAAANLTLDARAGGCFCEVLPGEGGAAPRGGVEHARVIFIDRDKALRLSGALGPLQSEGLTGTLTITLKAVEGGTRITWEYVVNGFMRYKSEQIAPAVDKVIGDQATRLAAKLGARAVSRKAGPEIKSDLGPVQGPANGPEQGSEPKLEPRPEPTPEPGMESGR